MYTYTYTFLMIFVSMPAFLSFFGTLRNHPDYRLLTLKLTAQRRRRCYLPHWDQTVTL